MSNSNKSAPAAAKQNQGTASLVKLNVNKTKSTYVDTSALYLDDQTAIERLQPYQSKVNMHDLANDIEKFISAHFIVKKEAVHAILLWVLSSYLINEFVKFPKLALISPQKRCGKTTAMAVIGSLARDPIPASGTSAPVLYRITER